MLEVIIHDPTDPPEKPCTREWVEDDELESYRAQMKEHGCTVEVVGTVSWQTQLAAMENPPL